MLRVRIGLLSVAAATAVGMGPAALPSGWDVTSATYDARGLSTASTPALAWSESAREGRSAVAGQAPYTRGIMSTSQRFTAKDDGVHLHYTDTQPDATEGPAIILLHGVASYGTAQYAELGVVDGLKDTMRVIVLDWRGHGMSSHVPLETVTLRQIARDLQQLIQELKLDRDDAGYVLYGMSTGWAIVLTYLALFKDAAPPGLLGLINEDMTPVMAPSEGWDGMGPAGPALGNIHRQLRDGGIDLLNADSGPIVCSDGERGGGERYEACNKLLRMAYLATLPGAMQRIMSELFFELDGRETIAQVGRNGTPSLILNGQFSMLGEKDMRKQAEIMRGEFQQFPTGHCIHAVDPEGLTQAMKKFLEEKVLQK